MVGHPLQSRLELRENIRLASLAIFEKGKLVTLRSLRKAGIRGSTSRVNEIKNELIEDGTLPPAAIYSRRATGDLKWHKPVSDEDLRSSVLEACQTMVSVGESLSVWRLRNAGVRGSEDRITWMVKSLRESGLIDGKDKPKTLDADMTFTQRMVRLYPGGRKRLRREFSSRPNPRDCG